MPVKVKVEIHKPRAMAKIRAAGDQGLTDVRDEIIDDINHYVPVSGGTPQNGGGGDLRRSAEIHSDQQAKDGSLKVRWDTPYAQYQHEGKVMHGTPKDKNLWTGTAEIYGTYGEKRMGTVCRAETWCRLEPCDRRSYEKSYAVERTKMEELLLNIQKICKEDLELDVNSSE